MTATHISIVVEHVETGDLSRCTLQIRHELCGFGGIRDLGNSLESSPEDERDGNGELHDV